MTARLLPSGLLAPWMGGFEEYLARLGYAPWTIRSWVWRAAHFECWLQREGVGLGVVDDVVVARYASTRREGGARTYVTVKGFSPLLSFLRSVGAIRSAVVGAPAGDVEAMLVKYRRFLIDERGLKPRSVKQCLITAGEFVAWLDGCPFGSLDAHLVRAFVTHRSAGLAPETVGHLVWSLRSLLKWLFLEGITGQALADTVPPVRSGSRSRSIPAGVSAEVLSALIGSCGTTTAGRRAKVALMLMGRLGLRAGEVCRLGLDDVDWRAGEIVIAGKGGRIDRLPLPVDVGEAVADYLRFARPSSTCRTLLLSLHAPIGAITPTGMNRILVGACRDAGVDHVRPHQLRHAAASRMLAAGSSLTEIAQVLRHVDVASTAIYAKVDDARLITIARPWPVAVTR